MGAAEIKPHPIWPENELPIAVALECHWERQIGFGGRDWQGVRSTEIDTVLRTRRIKPGERQVLMGQVRLFVGVACSELNKLEAQRAEEARSK